MRPRAWTLAAGAAIAAMAMAATAATVATAAEGSAPEVSPRVTTVATGGEWSSPKGSGVLRVVIADEGFTHVHSRLWIEWLAVGERGAPRRVARVLVKELSNGMNVIDAGNRRETFQDGHIRLRATHTYSHESSDITIETGKPGEYKLP